MIEIDITKHWPMKEEVKLKIYAIASAKKIQPSEVFQSMSTPQLPEFESIDDMFLDIVSGYTLEDAIMTHRSNMAKKFHDFKPEEWNIAIEHTNAYFETLVPVIKIMQMIAGIAGNLPPNYQNPYMAKPDIVAPPKVETKEDKLQKSVLEMTSYIRYVFDKTGDDEQKKIAEEVINKFINQNKTHE